MLLTFVLGVHAREPADEDVETIVIRPWAQTVVLATATSHTLEESTAIHCPDMRVSELIDFLSAATDLRFRVESTNILTRRVAISTGWKGDELLGARIIDVLTSLCEHFDCEVSILLNGDVLLKPKSPSVSDVHDLLEILEKSSQEIKWRERSRIMTEKGLMEQGGNLVWFCLAIREDNLVGADTRNAVASILTHYDLADLQKPSSPQPYADGLSKVDRELACLQRNKLFIGIMDQLKARTFTLLDELESALIQSEVSLPMRDIRAEKWYSLSNGVASVHAGTRRARYQLTFRRLGDDWKFDGTRW